MSSKIRHKSQIWQKKKQGIVGTVLLASFLLAFFSVALVHVPVSSPTPLSSLPPRVADEPDIIFAADFSAGPELGIPAGWTAYNNPGSYMFFQVISEELSVSDNSGGAIVYGYTNFATSITAGRLEFDIMMYCNPGGSAIQAYYVLLQANDGTTIATLYFADAKATQTFTITVGSTTGTTHFAENTDYHMTLDFDGSTLDLAVNDNPEVSGVSYAGGTIQRLRIETTVGSSGGVCFFDNIIVEETAEGTLPTTSSPADFSYYSYAEAQAITWVVTDPDIEGGAYVEVRRDGTVLLDEDFTETGQEVKVTCKKDTIGVHAYTLYVDDGSSGLLLLDTVQVTALQPEVDTDFDGLTDYEELRIYGSDPNSAASPAWNVGHFNLDPLGAVPTNWVKHNYQDSLDGTATVTNSPNWVGTDGTPCALIYNPSPTSIEYLAKIELKRQVSLGGSNRYSYVSFQMGCSVANSLAYVDAGLYMGEWHVVTIAMMNGLIIANPANPVNIGTYACNQLYKFEILIDFTNEFYNVYIDGIRVASNMPTIWNYDVSIIMFSANNPWVSTLPRLDNYIYIDNVYAGNCEGETLGLITGATIPIITTKLYAPPVGAPNSYQKITTTQGVSMTSGITLSVEGSIAGISGSGEYSQSSSLGCEDSLTWIANRISGDKWCGMRVKADIQQIGFRYSGALQNHLITAFAINSDPSYTSYFQANLADFFTAFHDYYPECQTPEELLPFLPDPQVSATYGPGGNAEVHNYAFGYPGQTVTRTWTATSIQTWNIGGGYECELAGAFTFSFNLKFESTSQTSITYEWEIYIETNEWIELDCNTYKAFNNLGFWFVDRTPSHEDTTTPLIDIQYSGHSTNINPGQWCVAVADPESGIESITVKVDGTQVGTTAGNYAVPSTIGSHTIIVEAVNAEEEGQITIREKTVNIVEGDPTPPVIQITHIGETTDGNPGWWYVTYRDYQSSITSVVVKADGTQVGVIGGEYAVPHSFLGNHILEVSVSNGDKTGSNSLTTALSDDDPNAPVNWGTNTILHFGFWTTIYVSLSDPSGVSGGTVYWSDLTTSTLVHVNGDLWSASTPWGPNCLSFTASDTDNDRPGDSTSSSYPF